MSRAMSNRTFGVEIECYGPENWEELASLLCQNGLEVHERYNCYNKWTMKSDCSIHPSTANGRYLRDLEIVSPILRGAAGLKEVRTVAQLLSKHGWFTNRTCGLHVHVGIEDLQPEEAYMVLKRYAENEDEIDTFVEQHRRGADPSWCSSAKPALQKFDTKRKNDAVRLFTQRLGRFLEEAPSGGKVNTYAFHRHATIEFRQHHGTINSKEITNWIRFIVNLVDTSVDLTEIKHGNSKRPARRLNDTGIFLGLPTRTRVHLRERVRPRLPAPPSRKAA